MAQLKFLNSGEEFELADNTSIQPPCEEVGVPFACSEGICGTCIVEVVEGKENLTAPTEAELNFLGEEGVCKERMACQCKIKGGCVKLRF